MSALLCNCNSRLHLFITYAQSPARLVICAAVAEVTSRVFGVIQRECVHPFPRTCEALIPVVQRAVLKVTQGFVCADSEGGARHSQRVTVQQRREVVHGAQYPAKQVIEHGEEPEDQRGHADPSEVKRREDLHVESLVALVRRVIVAEESLTPHRLRTLSQSSGCE